VFWLTLKNHTLTEGMYPALNFEKEPTMALSDYDYVNFSEDYELDYHL